MDNHINNIEQLCQQLFANACKHKLVWRTRDTVDVVARSEKDIDEPSQNMIYYTYHSPNLFIEYRRFKENLINT